MELPLQPKETPQSRFERLLKQYIQWIRTHQEQFWAITGTAAGAAILVAFMIHRRQTENNDAWTQLGIAQGFLMQNQYDQTAKALDQWTTRYKGSNATAYAKFLRADLQYRTSDYASAASTYKDLSQTGQPMEIRPLALSAESSSEEMAGRLQDAQASAQQFLDKYPDHFMAAGMYISQARLSELTGNAANASALYDRFVILYPQSPWTAFAKARLQVLGTPSNTLPIKK